MSSSEDDEGKPLLNGAAHYDSFEDDDLGQSDTVPGTVTSCIETYWGLQLSSCRCDAAEETWTCQNGHAIIRTSRRLR